MKTYTHFIAVFLLLLLSCKTHFVPVSDNAAQIAVNEKQTDSISEISKILKPYRDSMSVKMNEVIGYAAGDFVKERPGGSLGNLVTDAMLDFSLKKNPRTKGAICNFGGIRIPVMPKGNITVGKIFEMLPFENELVILALNQETFNKWYALILQNGGWPIAIQKSVGNDSLYYYATNDYVANGGDNCDFLKSCKRENTGVMVRDILINYIKEKKTLIPDTLSR